MEEQLFHKDALYSVIKLGFAALIAFLGFYQYRQLVAARDARAGIIPATSHTPCIESESKAESNFTTFSGREQTNQTWPSLNTY